jgi:uncharacterized membrane protein
MANSQNLTFGQRMADKLTRGLGSWTFLLIQSLVLVLWLILNAHAAKPFDPFPFILLNLMLSFQAAYSAPIIMISQNRLAAIDRQIAKKDLDVGVLMQKDVENIVAGLSRATVLLEKIVKQEQVLQQVRSKEE